MVFSKIAKGLSGLGTLVEERTVQLSSMILAVALRDLDNEMQVTLALTATGQTKIYKLDKGHVDGLIGALSRLRGEEI